MPRGKYLNSSNIFVILEIASTRSLRADPRRENIIKVLLNEYRKLLFRGAASCENNEKRKGKTRTFREPRWPLVADFINYETDTMTRNAAAKLFP